MLAGGIGYGIIIVLNAVQQELAGGTSDVRQELAEVKQRLEQLEASGEDTQAEDMDLRLAEVEERLEFAERLLSSEDNRTRLPEPSDEVSAESDRSEAAR